MSSAVGPIQAPPAVALPGDGLRALVPPSAPPPAPPAPAQAPASVAVDAKQPASPDALASAVRELAERAAQSTSELRFRVDQDAGRVVVSIVDHDTGDVLMQIPSEEALRLAKLLSHKDCSLIEAVV